MPRAIAPSRSLCGFTGPFPRLGPYRLSRGLPSVASTHSARQRHPWHCACPKHSGTSRCGTPLAAIATPPPGEQRRAHEPRCGGIGDAEPPGDVAQRVARRPQLAGAGAGLLSLRWHRHRPLPAARARPRGACGRRRPAASAARASARRIGRRGRCPASRRRPCIRAAPRAEGT